MTGVNMKKKLIVAVITLVLLSACTNYDRNRGTADAPVGDVNDADMNLVVMMADGFRNIAIKCLGPVGFTMTTDGIMSGPNFMDPYCVGVVDKDGNVNQERLEAYITYLAAVRGGNTNEAETRATQLIKVKQ